MSAKQDERGKIQAWYLDSPKHESTIDPNAMIELSGWVVDENASNTHFVIRDEFQTRAYPLNRTREDLKKQPRFGGLSNYKVGFHYKLVCSRKFEIGFEHGGRVTWVAKITVDADGTVELAVDAGSNSFSSQRRHLLISGTGRAGTSFLTALLTRLGMDTGFEESDLQLDEISRAGLEVDPRSGTPPYVIKSPWLCDYLESWVSEYGPTIDGVIIPVRDIKQAAESRRAAQRDGAGSDTQKHVAGGLWKTADPERQEEVLRSQFYNLMQACAALDLPVVLLSYPRLMGEPEYLFEKLRNFLGGVSYDEFLPVFEQTLDPTWVHNYENVAD